MPVFAKTIDPEFDAVFDGFLMADRDDALEIDTTVGEIIADVRKRQDEALIDMTAKFDGWRPTRETLAFSADEIAEICARVAPEEARALEHAAERIRAFHVRQLPQDEYWEDEVGARLGWRWGSMESAGLYVPGGLASYPSSVLMNAIPARVAGVSRVVMSVPTPGGEVNPLVLLAARIAGVDEIYRLGGAQAVAALAYGTQSIAPVDKITGPGNAYVAAAKRQVFGKVGIDMIAGPSEIVIIADGDNSPQWLALDLLGQAEHDERAQAVLITTDASLATRVADAVAAQLKVLERREIAARSWRDHGAIFVVRDLEEAAQLSNRLAPEHLELCVGDPEDLAQKIKHAGAIFLGPWTPEAIGDYVGGPNHVLPTSRSARFSSGLSVLDFLKRTTISKMSPGALSDIGPAAVTLATSEGLEAHALSVRARLDHLNE